MLWDRGTYELLGDASADEQLARGDFKKIPGFGREDQRANSRSYI